MWRRVRRQRTCQGACKPDLLYSYSLLRGVHLLELGDTVFEVGHPASALGPLEVSLLGPTVRPHPGIGVAAGSALSLLDVIRTAAAPPADGVALVVPWTKGRSSSAHSLKGRPQPSQYRLS